MSLVQANLLKLAMRVSPTTKSGKRFRGTGDGIAIASSTGASPIEITTSVTHGLATGDMVTISGHVTNTSANNTAANPAWSVIVTSSTKFTLTGSVYTAAGVVGTVFPFMVGSVDSARFTRQRLLDIYNDARMALFNALYEVKGSDELSRYVYGSALNANLTFAYSSPYTSAAIPTGYIRLIGITAYNASRVIVLPNNLLPETLPGTHPYYTTSATNLLAFQIGSNFKVCGDFHTELGDGSSSHYATINYYGIAAWTWWTDVLPNTTVEVFSPDIEPILIELACAIADEQSNADVLALAKTLLNKKEK